MPRGLTDWIEFIWTIAWRFALKNKFGSSTSSMSSIADMLSFKNRPGESIAYATNASDIKLLAGGIVRVVTVQVNDAEESTLGNFKFYGHLVFAE